MSKVRLAAAWGGWALGLGGWAISNQLSVYLVDLDCARASPPIMVAISAAGALLAITGALLSLAVWRRRTRADVEGSAFVALTASMAGGIFLLAILFQTLSTLIVPPCHA